MNDKLKITIDNSTAKKLDEIKDKTLIEEGKENIDMGQQTNLIDINETVDVARLFRKTGDVLHDVMNPNSPGGKKINLMEYPQFFPVLITDFPAALKGIGKIPYELADEVTAVERGKIKEELLKSKFIQEMVLRGYDADEIVDDHLRVLFDAKNLLFKYYINVNIPAPQPDL
jgi:hypothetical protein